MNELVRDRYGLLRVGLVVTGLEHDLLAEHAALFVPFINGKFDCVPEIDAHLALVAGQGAHGADSDDVFILARAAKGKNNEREKDSDTV
jgi:hypothetical protein